MLSVFEQPGPDMGNPQVNHTILFFLMDILNNLKIIVVVTLYIALRSFAEGTSRSVEKDCCVLSSWEQKDKSF